MFSTTENRMEPARPNLLRRIWLLTSDARAAQAVRTTLDAEKGFALSGVCEELSELAVVLEREAAPAAVVDIDSQPTRMLRELEPVIARFPHTRFVVLCSSFSNDLILESMEVGARHFIPKQAVETDLATVLKRLTPGAAASRDDQRGMLVTVLSAGGGCGATTLAVNLAAEFSVLTRSASLLVDLDTAYGAVATYLGLSGEYGIADILARRGGIDPQLIRSTVVSHGETLHALLSPASVDLGRAAPLSCDRIETATEACSGAYAYTVIDAPRVSMDMATALAMESGCTLIVGQLSVKDIRMSRAIRALLVDRGVPARSIRFVAGRYTKHGPLSRSDVERGLGGTELDLIHNDYKAASYSINIGELLAKAAPRSTLRCDIQRLATQVHQRFQSVPFHSQVTAVAG